MAGISSKAAETMQNKDKTFQGQKFDDDLGLNWIEYKYRNHDPQIGRFIEIDPLSDKYVYNSTYAFSENKVTNHVELEGLESVEAAIANAWRELQANFRSLTTITTYVDKHISTEHTKTVTIPLASAPGMSVSVGSTYTTTNSFNFTGILENVLNSNTNKSTPFFKSSTTVTSAEIKTEIAGAITTKSAIDTKGVASQEFGGKGTVKVEGVPVTFQVGFATNSENKNSMSVQASTGITSAAQVLVKAKGTSENLTVGAGVQYKAGKTTVTESYSFKFYY